MQQEGRGETKNKGNYAHYEELGATDGDDDDDDDWSCC